jgi:hypothetical protein
LKIVSHQLQDLTALEKLFINDFNGEEFEEALPTFLFFNILGQSFGRISSICQVQHAVMQHLSKLNKFWYLGISLFFQKIVAMAMALS